MTGQIGAVVRLDPADNVVVATRTLAPGEVVEGFALKQEIPRGHDCAEPTTPDDAELDVSRSEVQAGGFHPPMLFHRCQTDK